MKVGFTTTCAISGYHHLSCESEPCPCQGVLNTTLFDIVRQLLATGRRFSLGTPVSFSNKTDRHDITHILLKVALNTISHKSNQLWRKYNPDNIRIQTSTCISQSNFMFDIFFLTFVAIH